ncbi:Hypothetical predicted protein [Podarcis lilfordi]|uniref:Uncharacterized protein n=1 Tax=Podarcis lilfordi TaxID=74358 RepID=A0AA35JXL8_9SAUR|nr:Hypothetical predicted protein [Podarcis lilfordi]
MKNISNTRGLGLGTNSSPDPGTVRKSKAFLRLSARAPRKRREVSPAVPWLLLSPALLGGGRTAKEQQSSQQRTDVRESGAAIPRDMAPMYVAPMYNTGNISGYEGTTAAGGKHCPPPPNLIPRHGNGQQPPQRTWNVPAITEDEAKEAFIQYASSKCCYSTDPAKEMVFNDLQLFNTYRYKLETFTESRFSEYKAEPYGGKCCYASLQSSPT